MIWKELTQVSNRARFSILMGSLAGLLAVVFIFMSYGRVYERGEIVTPERMARFGREFFLSAVAVLSVAMSLAVLIIASGIVVREHVGRRLELLLVTPLALPAIVGAKAFSVFARAAAGLLVGLPVFTLLLIFGGVDGPMVIQALVFVSSNMLLYASIGLFASVLGRKTSSSLAWAGVLTLAWNLLPLLYLFGVMLWAGRASEELLQTNFSMGVFSLSPFFTYTVYLVNPFAGMGMGPGMGVPWTLNGFNVHVTANVAVSGVVLLAAFIIFRPVARRRVSAGEGKRGALWSRLTFRRKRGAPTRRPPGRLARLWGEGMVSRELSSWRPRKALLSLGWFALVYGFVALVSSATGQWPQLYDANDQAALFIAEQMGFCFLLAVRASLRFAKEKESRTIQQLLVTRLGRLRIIAGKGAALCIEQAPGIVFLAAHLIFILAVTRPGATLWWLVLAGLPVSLLFAVALGFYYSLAAGRVVSAVVMTALTWLFGAFAALLFVAILLEATSSRTIGEVVWIPLFAAAILALAAALFLSRTKGYGVLVAALCFMLLLTCGIVVGGQAFETEEIGILGGGGRISVGEGFLMLPGPFLSLFDDADANAYGLAFGAMQAALAGWIAFMLFLGFEAQAKRAY
jgi:hypothetical protein